MKKELSCSILCGASCKCECHNKYFGWKECKNLKCLQGKLNKEKNINRRTIQ